MVTFYGDDRFFATAGARGLVVYALLTGISSALVVWSERSPSMLGRAAWWFMVGWAVHLAILVGLINSGVLDLRALESEPRPFATLWFSVTVYVAVLLGVSWMLFRRRERATPGRSVGRRG
jgi:hypothetical protein